MKTLALFLAAWIAISGNAVHADDYNAMSFREMFHLQKPGQPYARIRILRRVELAEIKNILIFRAEVLEDFGSVVQLWKEIDILLTDMMVPESLAAKFTPGSEWITRLKVINAEGQPVKGLTGYLLAVDDHPGGLLSVKDGVVTGNILKKGLFPSPSGPEHPGPPESIKLEEFRKMMGTWKRKEAAPAK
jgi:hypothetical protein